MHKIVTIDIHTRVDDDDDDDDDDKDNLRTLRPFTIQEMATPLSLLTLSLQPSTLMFLALEAIMTARHQHGGKRKARSRRLNLRQIILETAGPKEITRIRETGALDRGTGQHTLALLLSTRSHT